jgi:FtsH-binding integral membrane protein
MPESGRATGFSTPSEDKTDRTRYGKQFPLIFLGMLVASVIGYFVTEGAPLWRFISNHMGGLAIVGLLACLAAFIAKKKRRNYKRAFALTVVVPVILGGVSVVLAYAMAGFVYCGGGVILAAALVMITVFSCLRKKPLPA